MTARRLSQSAAMIHWLLNWCSSQECDLILFLASCACDFDVITDWIFAAALTDKKRQIAAYFFSAVGAMWWLNGFGCLLDTEYGRDFKNMAEMMVASYCLIPVVFFDYEWEKPTWLPTGAYDNVIGCPLLPKTFPKSF